MRSCDLQHCWLCSEKCITPEKRKVILYLMNYSYSYTDFVALLNCTLIWYSDILHSNFTHTPNAPICDSLKSAISGWTSKIACAIITSCQNLYGKFSAKTLWIGLDFYLLHYIPKSSSLPILFYMFCFCLNDHNRFCLFSATRLLRLYPLLRTSIITHSNSSIFSYFVHFYNLKQKKILSEIFQQYIV